MYVLFLFVDATWDSVAMSFQIETPDSSSEGRETKLFPDQHSHDMNITAHALTTDFLIYASDVSGLPVGDSYAGHPAYSRSTHRLYFNISIMQDVIFVAELFPVDKRVVWSLL